MNHEKLTKAHERIEELYRKVRLIKNRVRKGELTRYEGRREHIKLIRQNQDIALSIKRFTRTNKNISHVLQYDRIIRRALKAG